jgi:uncharacterized protein YaaQ
MKLIIAIVHDQDAGNILDEFSDNGLKITKLCSTGGFIKSGNTTLISGVEDKDVEKALDIISRNTQIRTESLVSNLKESGDSKISIGAATIFITNVERFEKF